jgi:hypothetical protein
VPTFFHGRNTVFKITDATATLQDISDTLREVNFPITLDTPETTAFGSTVKTYVVGIKDAKFTCSGMFDPTTDGILEGIYGLAGGTAFEYGPSGSLTGEVKYTGVAILVNYGIRGAVNDMVAATVDFQVTGPITRGTY